MADTTSGFQPNMINWQALAALASGNTVGEQLGNMNATIAGQSVQAKETQAENATKKWLSAQFPGEDFSQLTGPALMAAYSSGLNRYAQARQPNYQFQTLPDGRYGNWDQNTGKFNVLGQAPKATRPNIISVGDGRLYDLDNRQYIMPPEGSDIDKPDLGLNPQYGVDAEGNSVLIQLSKDGKSVQSSLPDGVKLSKEPIKLDAGTHFVLLDPITRQNIGTIPKDISGVEQQKVEGKTLGDNKAQLPSALAKADQTINDIDEALTHPGLESATGWQSVFPTVAGTQSADFEAKLDKLKGGAFLEAFQSLKGGGQITEVEGKKATDAIAVLSTSQSDSALRKALVDLREVIATGRDRALRSAGAQPTGGTVTLGPNGEGYDQLPPGAKYVSPDGKTRVKGGT